MLKLQTIFKKPNFKAIKPIKLQNYLKLCFYTILRIKSLTFEPTVRFSSVIPFWKPQKVKKFEKFWEIYSSCTQQW